MIKKHACLCMCGWLIKRLCSECSEHRVVHLGAFLLCPLIWQDKWQSCVKRQTIASTLHCFSLTSALHCTCRGFCFVLHSRDPVYRDKKCRFYTKHLISPTNSRSSTSNGGRWKNFFHPASKTNIGFVRFHYPIRQRLAVFSMRILLKSLKYACEDCSNYISLRLHYTEERSIHTVKWK